MSITSSLRRCALALLSSCVLSTAFVAAPVVLGTTTAAQAQVSAEFESALEPYGEWVRHPRWGMVWTPYDRSPDWRPYTEGRWVYTDEWGWYWISEGDEEDWGWVTYHYGRWVLDRGMGWVWVPGDEWAPAWVDWRRGGEYVGWAPSPPDEVIYEYDDNPGWWIFVPPRYMTAPRVYQHVLPPRRSTVIIRQTVIVNRTLPLGQGRGRFAVNPGISPNVVAAIGRQPVRTFRVAPRVLPVTQGVQGAVTVQPQALGPRRAPNPQVRVSVQPTNQTVAPIGTVRPPQALPRNERGRLGDRPPRAAQGAQPAPLPQQQPTAQPAPNGRPVPPQAPPPPPRVGSPPPPSPAPSVQPSPNGRPTPPPAPAQPAPQVRPPRPTPPQAPPPPPRVGTPPSPPPATQAPSPPPPRVVRPPAPPATTRPTPPPPPAARPAPPPPAVQHAPPPARLAPPPAARPAPPPPPQARPAPPPQARPAPPPQARPAPPPQARPAPPPQQRPAERRPPQIGDKPEPPK